MMKWYRLRTLVTVASITMIAASVIEGAEPPQAFYSHTSGPPPGDGFEWAHASPDFPGRELQNGETFITPDLGVEYGGFSGRSTFIDAGYAYALGWALEQSGHIDREAWWGSAGSLNPEVNFGFTGTPAGGVETFGFDLVWVKLFQPTPANLRIRVNDYISHPSGPKREAIVEVDLPDIFDADPGDVISLGRAGRVEIDFRDLADDLSGEPFEQIEGVWVELEAISDDFGPPFNIFAIDNVSINRDPVINGDYNRDGAVDAADYVVWRESDGTPIGYDKWRANFGSTLPGAAATSGPGALAAAPESPTLVMLLVAAAGSRLRHRCFAWR